VQSGRRVRVGRQEEKRRHGVVLWCGRGGVVWYCSEIVEREMKRRHEIVEREAKRDCHIFFIAMCT
jgi:hypothetical protein